MAAAQELSVDRPLRDVQGLSLLAPLQARLPSIYPPWPTCPAVLSALKIALGRKSGRWMSHGVVASMGYFLYWGGSTVAIAGRGVSDFPRSATGAR